MRLKEIQIQPSEWVLDVFQFDKKDEQLEDSFHKYLSKRYGASVDHYKEWLEDSPGSFVSHVKSTKKSKMHGDTRIIMFYDGNDNVLVHELLHVLWRFSSLCGVEMNYDSQEWQAILLEHLFIETLDSKGFVKLE